MVVSTSWKSGSLYSTQKVIEDSPVGRLAATLNITCRIGRSYMHIMSKKFTDEYNSKSKNSLISNTEMKNEQMIQEQYCCAILIKAESSCLVYTSCFENNLHRVRLKPNEWKYIISLHLLFHGLCICDCIRFEIPKTSFWIKLLRIK